MDGANGQIKEVTKEESLKKEEELKIKIFIIPRPTKTTTRRIITYNSVPGIDNNNNIKQQQINKDIDHSRAFNTNNGYTKSSSKKQK